MMNALTFSYARKNLAEVMRTVSDDHAPVVVTHQNAKPVVIMSLEDYQSLNETSYLLRNPTGSHRLLKAVEELRGAKHVHFEQRV
jgi:antitoxin YefM